MIQDNQGLFPGQAAFFNAINGWQNFAIAQQSYTSGSMLLNLVNQTGTQFTVTASAKIDFGGALRGSASRTLGPYLNFLSVVDLVKDKSDSIEFTYQIFDASISTTDPVISFTAQVQSADPGGIISVQDVSAPDSSFISATQLVNANGLQNTPASMTVTIFS